MNIQCPVCKGMKVAPSGNRCGCCGGKGFISEEIMRIKESIKKDLTARQMMAEKWFDEL